MKYCARSGQTDFLLGDLQYARSYLGLKSHTYIERCRRHRALLGSPKLLVLTRRVPPTELKLAIENRMNQSCWFTIK